MTETILDEAARVTSKDRNVDYGHPRDNLSNTAEHFTSYLRRRFADFTSSLDGRDVAMLMVLVKVSRDANRRKRDNLVDIAGWARVAEMLEEVEHEPVPESDFGATQGWVQGRIDKKGLARAAGYGVACGDEEC